MRDDSDERRPLRSGSVVRMNACLMLVCVAGLLLPGCLALPGFPNIEFLGMGYNVILGNPLPAASTDLGWTSPVVALTFIRNQTTSDGRYQLPDLVNAMPLELCVFGADTSTITTIQDYQQLLSGDVSVSFKPLPDYAFSASVGYVQQSEMLNQGAQVSVYAKAVCQTYVAKFLPYLQVNLSQSFLNGVASLPPYANTSSAERAYLQFLASFGTHYSTSINMGAKAALQYSMSSSASQQLLQRNVSLSVGAQLDFLSHFGADISTEQGYQDYVSFSQAVTSTEALGEGLPPPVSSDLSSWQAWLDEINNSTLLQPFPIQYSLESIETLLNASYFPQDPAIQQKQASLKHMLKEYCGYVPNCTAPPKPTPPPSSNIGWPMYGFNAQHTHQSPYYGIQSCSLRWRVEFAQGIVGSPVIGPDGTVYVAAMSGLVSAVSPHDGSTKWSFTSLDQITTTPALEPDGELIVASTGVVYGLNSASGSSYWKASCAGTSPALATIGTIYIGGYGCTNAAGALTAVDHAAGKVKWQYNITEWIRFPPAVALDGTIYVVTNSTGTVKAVVDHGFSFTQAWDYTMGAGSAASPAIDKFGVIYVGDNSGVLHAISPAGSQRWALPLCNLAISSVAIGADNTLYLACYNILYAVNAQAGTWSWRFETDAEILGAPAVDGSSTIFVTTLTGSIYAVSSGGTQLWFYQTGGAINGSPTIGSDGSIYVGSDDGYLYAFGPGGSGC